MEKLHKEPDVSRQDYYAFVNELKLFHQNRGTPFRHLPKINGREIDLQKLYNQVTALGGLQKVIEHQKWDSVAEVLKLPKACANFALSLRQIYIRFLGHYEKIHFMGEEPDHDKNQSSESHSRKLQLTLFHQVPMVYNALQHEVTDASRSTSGLNQVFTNPTDYDKLCMSLLCGLPNEQELALNVCTILSNEGNYMLHLEQAPKLVDLLIAQAGVWRLDDDSFKMLYLESWKDLKGRNMHRFWRSTLDVQNLQLVQLLGLDLGEKDPDETILNVESDLGALNVEGQRVLRVALILHNLSFEKNNVPVLVGNSNFIRFLLLCIHSSWANLRQTAYDTLSNLASEIKLSIEKDLCSRIMFQAVMDGIISSDRYMNIRSMDILAQLCSFEPNEDIIPSRLDVEVYQQMVSFLTIHDVMLLFYTLEALYALSDLGRYACDKIVIVHRCIGALVSLLTLEPNQYGPSGQIKMKIVETLVPAESDGEQEEKPAATEQATSSASSNGDTDSETFACNWLKSAYEVSAGSTISRNDIYADYVSYCAKSGRKGVVNANIFASCVKNTFPQCGLKKIESGSGVITFHHDGLKRKKVLTTQTGPPNLKSVNNSSPLKKVPPTSPASCKPGQKSSHSPILNAQLSAPPRSGVSSPPLKRPQVNVANGQKYPTSTTSTPTTSGSSTLIKSLLANKVQQRNLQRQVVPQNVSKMVIYSPEKVTPLSQGIISSPTAVVRCVRPGGLSQVNFGTQIRTPIQARLVPNKGRLITAASPRVIKSNPIVSPKMQAKVVKQAVISTATSARLNGVQRDVQMEVCNQDEDSRSIGESTYTEITQMNCLQNHISNDSLIDAKDSSSCDGDSLLSSKDIDINSDSDKNILISQIPENTITYRLATPNELPTSPNNLLLVRSKSSSDGLSPPKEQNGSAMTFVNSTIQVTGLSLVTQSLIQPKILSSSSSILKSVLGDLDSQTDELTKQQQIQKDKICKRAPLLNGLLDKGKVPLPGEVQSSTLLQNGNKLGSSGIELCSDENKSSTSFVQSSTLNSAVIPVSSLNSVVSATSLNSFVIPASSLNSVIIPASSLSSAIVPTLNSAVTYVSTLNSSVSPVSVLNSAILPTTTFHSNGDNLMQICTGQTTLSGTIEVQPDQKGVVRLHIESPENSNQGSDLSSISDIARTLECASKAISRTNAECNTQVPYCGTCETTATVTVITTNTSTLARTGQQIIVVTPALNQPQLHIQSPNIKFRILHSLPKVEESVDLIGFPRVNVNQLNQARQPAPETPSNSTANLKRPSSDITTCVNADVKKPRIDTKTPLLEATLRLPTPVPCTVATSSVNAKPFHETQSFLMKSSQIENLGSTPKLTTAKAVAVPVQNIDFPNEREAKTFSGLSSASDNPSLSAPPQVPPRSLSSTKLEYICEWKECGLKFANPGSVFLHASKIHAPLCNDDMICLWEGCDSMKRRRFSLLTHLQDWHCNERVLHTQALRRKQISQQGKTSIAPPQMPPPHPGYAPDAALLAIRRHALQYINPKELSEEKESALTKSIRLTSALILRNLVTHSSLARTYVRRFEPELAYLAMSPVESARTIAQCLSQLSRPHD
ncbi:LOW QUALITY PROTEIN: AT-rich interactive domain-containing protein 2-like [Uloborus diversus]|uniref:LOW QUALITY PROTEIN: AT-rich interactive domain-containing protein 2-like n=2 Tax=Uloborus diversus TaxID=327109 RepID=UPI002409783D|nr:LOW QUALITY PROTEIN: AT-rich interactive domain-containing protein 2-like [Uloborus diversus]